MPEASPLFNHPLFLQHLMHRENEGKFLSRDAGRNQVRNEGFNSTTKALSPSSRLWSQSTLFDDILTSTLIFIPDQLTPIWGLCTMFIIHPCCPARLLFASRSATLKIRPYTALGDTSLRSKTMLKTGLIAMERVFTGMAQTSDRTMMITTTISVMPHGVSRAEKEELMSGIPPGKALECRTTHGKVQAGADKLMSDSHHEKPGMTPVARAVDPKVHTNRLKMITRSMTAATNGKPQGGVRRLMSDVRG